MNTLLRLLALVVLLNLIRYVVGGLIEFPLIMPSLMGAMDANPEIFNQEFTTFDWTTSFFYNFMMWFAVVWLFHLLRPVLSGTDVVRSLKTFGIAWIFFASVSALYMNHYSHPKAFYGWNILDGLLVYTIVAVANGLLYGRVMGKRIREEPPG